MSRATILTTDNNVYVCFTGCENYQQFKNQIYNDDDLLSFVLIQRILTLIYNNGNLRTLYICGTEPLCEHNLFSTVHLIGWCRHELPQASINVYTHYNNNELIARDDNDIKVILKNTTLHPFETPDKFCTMCPIFDFYKDS